MLVRVLLTIFLYGFVCAIAATVVTVPFLAWNVCSMSPPEMVSCSAQFVDRFQTLITGVLAVAAAFITVAEMRQSDSNAKRRHEEALALGIRSELRKIDRALHPQMEDLASPLKKVENFDFTFFRFGKVTDPEWELTTAASKELLEPLQELIDIINRKPFREAEHLFDGRLCYALATMEQATNHVIGRLRVHSLILDERETPTEKRENYISWDWPENEYTVCSDIQKLPMHLREFVGELQRFSTEQAQFRAKYT